MAALFAEGKHPNADAITQAVMDRRSERKPAGSKMWKRRRSGSGSRSRWMDTAPGFRVEVARRCAQVQHRCWGCRRDWPTGRR